MTWYTNSQRLVVLFSLLVIAVCFLNSQRLVVCVCFIPIHYGHQVRWTYQPGSHRRKVTHCYIPSSVAVHYLKTELTYLSSQSPGVSIHHSTIIARVISLLLVLYYRAGRPGSSEVPRNPLTRSDVSSIPANGIFLKLKTKIIMPNGWRTIKSLAHKIRLHGRRGKGMAESFSREKLRRAPQKEGG